MPRHSENALHDTGVTCQRNHLILLCFVPQLRQRGLNSCVQMRVLFPRSGPEGVGLCETGFEVYVGITVVDLSFGTTFVAGVFAVFFAEEFFDLWGEVTWAPIRPRMSLSRPSSPWF